MNFICHWLNHNETYSCGFVTSEDKKTFRAFSLADPPRDKKITSLTRFKAGTYELKICKLETPLTLTHRKAYNKNGEWFKFHIEITGIPEYKSCYVHSGIDATHTDGCLLLMYAFDLTKAANQGSISLASVKDFYALVYPLLEKGTRCYITFKDENEL